MDFRSAACSLILLTAAAAAQTPVIGGCDIFPANNIWNTAVDRLPVDPSSAVYVETIGAGKPLVTDLSIPFIVVPASPTVPVTFTDYGDESDPGPYPIPLSAPVEGGSGSTGDRHVIALDKDNCKLYELFHAFPQSDGSGWRASSGAVFDLKTNALRPLGWTSSDAAGFPVLPGLLRYDEIAAGEIRHALRFTVPQTRKKYIWPATHYASRLTDSKYPPMGQRFRLRADFDVSGYTRENQIILRALKKYGMLLADNGSSWFISGAPDNRWNNDQLRELRRLHGSDFEAVDESSLRVDAKSAVVNAAALDQAASTAPTFAAALNEDYSLNGDSNPAAPGSIVMLFGSGDNAAISGGLTARIGGLGAEIFYAGAAPSLPPGAIQINARVPPGLPPGRAAVWFQTGAFASQADAFLYLQ